MDATASRKLRDLDVIYINVFSYSLQEGLRLTAKCKLREMEVG
jgi:hypothetical protein